MNRKTLGLEAGAIILILVVLGGWWYGSAKTSPALKASGSKTTVVRKLPDPDAVAFSQVAVATTTISISACVPTPAIASFSRNVRVIFVNKDKVPHTIYFSPKFTFEVQAGGKNSQSFAQWNEPGVRKYRCDRITAAGGVYITD